MNLSDEDKWTSPHLDQLLEQRHRYLPSMYPPYLKYSGNLLHVSTILGSRLSLSPNIKMRAEVILYCHNYETNYAIQEYYIEAHFTALKYRYVISMYYSNGL